MDDWPHLHDLWQRCTGHGGATGSGALRPRPAHAASPHQDVLSAAELRHFEEHGYLVLRGAVPRAQCAATQAAIWNYLDASPDDAALVAAAPGQAGPDAAVFRPSVPRGKPPQLAARAGRRHGRRLHHLTPGPAPLRHAQPRPGAAHGAIPDLPSGPPPGSGCVAMNHSSRPGAAHPAALAAARLRH